MTQNAQKKFLEEKERLELWEEHLKDPSVALDKACKCAEHFHGPERETQGTYYERTEKLQYIGQSQCSVRLRGSQ